MTVYVPGILYSSKRMSMKKIQRYITVSGLTMIINRQAILLIISILSIGILATAQDSLSVDDQTPDTTGLSVTDSLTQTPTQHEDDHGTPETTEAADTAEKPPRTPIVEDLLLPQEEKTEGEDGHEHGPGYSPEYPYMQAPKEKSTGEEETSFSSDNPFFGGAGI